jgi:hypothetical protein
MTDKKQPQQAEIKYFNLIISGEQITTSGNMTLNEVAAALITLAANAGYNQAQKEKEEDIIE